jgi:hypothetical protein
MYVQAVPVGAKYNKAANMHCDTGLNRAGAL